jgi:bromodomain adjacent to zinc finger domain protein 1A
MSFYRLKHFQCEVSGKSSLDYFQALDSEAQEARTMHSRFPEQLKPAILKAVQWRKYIPFTSWRLRGDMS